MGVEFHTVWNRRKQYRGYAVSEAEFPHNIDDPETLAVDLEKAAAPHAHEVDLVVVTQPVALLMAVLHAPSLARKPVVVYMSTIMQYMVRARDRSLFRNVFAAAARNPENTFVTQYPWLQLYVQQAGGGLLPAVRGLSLYTGIAAGAFRNATRGLLVLDRPFDDILPCLVLAARDSLKPAARTPINFRGRASWNEMAEFMAVAIFPYTFFLMAF